MSSQRRYHILALLIGILVPVFLIACNAQKVDLV